MVHQSEANDGPATTAADSSPVGGGLLTKTALKAEYGLTERLIGQIGPPDLTKPNPHYRSAAPMQLFQRERVEHWISANQQLLTASAKRRAASQNAVATKEERAREQVAALVHDLRIERVAQGRLRREAARYYRSRYEQWDGELTPRALCSYIRHNYSNYEEVLTAIHGKVGAGRLYSAAKLLLCAEIIRVYRLDLEASVAAFGTLDDKADAAGKDTDPLRAARELLGLVGPKSETGAATVEVGTSL